MSEVRQHFAQRNEFAFHQTSLVEGDDQEHIYRDAFLAWWMSPRPRPTMRVRALDGRLRVLAPFEITLPLPLRPPAPHRTGPRVVCVQPQARAASRSAKRRGNDPTTPVNDHHSRGSGTHRRCEERKSRSLLSPVVDRPAAFSCLSERTTRAETNLTKIKQEQSRYDVSLEVGDPEDMDEGLTATLNFTTIDNRECACASLVRHALTRALFSARSPPSSVGVVSRDVAARRDWLGDDRRFHSTLRCGRSVLRSRLCSPRRVVSARARGEARHVSDHPQSRLLRRPCE